MPSGDWTIEGLPNETHKLLKRYIQDVTNAYGNELEGIVLFGSAVRGEFMPGRSNLNVLLVMASYDLPVLKKYDGIHKRWSKEQIVVPLFLTAADLQSAASVFPLEYQDIQEGHRVLWGQDPFVGLKIDSRYVGVGVLQALRGNLLRLRQRLVEGRSTEEAITILLSLSITGLLPALRGLQRLLNRPVLAHGEPLLKDIESQLALNLTGLRDALSLKRGDISPGQKEIPRLMDRYIECLTNLVAAAEQRIAL
jgi:predicted nucleotidyltransferase